MKAIFKVKTLDRDTRQEYPASDVAVEVSDAFAARLMDHNQYGVSFELEDNEQDSGKPKKARKPKDD